MRSLPTIATITQLVVRHYGLEPVDVTLVRSFVNDVYRIETGEAVCALKLYGPGRFTADEVRWEQQFARHLSAAGIPVAAATTMQGGDVVGSIDAPEGERPFAMTAWLPGRKPSPPWTDDLYRRVGAALARLHEAADSFRPTLPRRRLRTGEEPGLVVAAVASNPARRRLVETASAAALAELERCAERGLRSGARHGDPSLDNLHLDDDDDGGVHYYDLDLSEPGWQVEDLTGAMTTEHAAAFLSGYTAVRTLDQVELDALPWLGLLARIDNLKFHLLDKPALQGTASLGDGWVDEGFDALATAAREAGLPT